METKPILKTEMGKILQSTPAERGRAIIDSPHTREILEQLSPQETYMIIKESWGTDSQILLQYVTPETICHCIDMDCWENDSLSISGMLDWLWEIYSSSVDALQDALSTIDLDLIVLLYQSYIDVVQVVPTDENIADLLDAGYETFDDVYYFVFQEEDEKVQLLKDMLSLLFTHYQNVYYSIMEGVIWELRSSIEENVYERRSLRLMEMGFPPPDEAASIYKRIQPKKLLNTGLSKEKTPIIDKDQGLLPALYLDHFSESRSLIASSISEAQPKTRERFIFEMIYLANKVVIADFKPLNDIEGLKLSMEKASSITSLGLSVAMREQKRTAREVLEEMNAETLFSLGFNMIQDQKLRLKQILAGIDSSMIPDALSGFVEGLMQKRPLYKTEEFSSIEQLEEVTRNIDRIEALNAVMERLGWADGKDLLFDTNTGTEVDMETVILTSLAINSLTGESVFRPLHRQELVQFIGAATALDAHKKRTIAPKFRESLVSFLKQIEASEDPTLVEDIADLLLARFEEEISGIKDIRELDPRFITCFVAEIGSEQA